MWVTYQWFAILGGILSFTMSWGIGANDVANSFSTAIGSKTLTLFQACCIAACLEFAGAISLGGEVSKTIAGSIANIDVFIYNPEIFAYGMMCSLFSATIWITLASYLALPVSTTHSIIGSVVGFTLVWKGSNAIIWAQPIDEFPYIKGLLPIFISWVTSPLMSSILSVIIYISNRTLVLRRQNSKQIVFYAFPPLVFITIFINLFFVLYKGAKAELHWDANKAAWVSTVTASGCSILSALSIPYLKQKVKNKIETCETVSEKNSLAVIQILSNITNSNLQVQEMHSTAEKFDEDTEYIYKYMQVFSSCCVAFAHGANDVSNAIGPYAAIWYVYNNMALDSIVDTPRWMLVLGGIGIVIGLWTYGYKVIKSLGGELCTLSPSRGYSAELATALTVSFASVYGIPISTTHCIVGAEIGIGIAENWKTGVNWKLFGKTATAWIFTLFISGLMSATIFAQGIYAPSIPMSHDIWVYEKQLQQIVIEKNKSLVNDTIFIDIFDPKISAYISPELIISYINQTCI
jgi:sodium-dependent phosphate transporter